jgi:hypothetical protein
MLIRILIKILTIILGIIALNAILWGAFLFLQQLEGAWISSIVSFLSKNLFIKLFTFFPFSWLISSLGFIAFVVYDYINYENSDRAYVENIKENFKQDCIAIFLGLLMILFAIILISIGFLGMQIIYDIFIDEPLFRIKLCKKLMLLMEIYYKAHIPIDLRIIFESYNAADFIISIIFFVIQILMIRFIIFYTPPKIADWKDYESKANQDGSTWFFRLIEYLIDKYNIISKIISILYILYIFPVTLVWITPLVIGWISLIFYGTNLIPSIREEGFLIFYSYTIVFVLSLYIIIRQGFKHYRNKKKSKAETLKNEIKNEILNEINTLTQKD